MKQRLYVSRKIIMFTVLVLLNFTNIGARFFVNPSTSDSLLNLFRKAGRTLDETRWAEGDVITEPTTITESGYYVLCNDINGSIIIATDNVTLDLNHYNIICDASTSGVVVNDNLRNIEIKDGSIKGAGVGVSTTSAVLVGQGSSLVFVQDLHIFDFENGIYFNGDAANYIEACQIKDCEIFDCNKGVVARYTIKTTLEHVEAKNCVYKGFEFYKSKFNVFDKCKAFETKSSDANEDTAGFESTSGQGNLFYECLAEGSERTDSVYCTKAAGFIFKGTATQAGETESKIIKCIANSTKITGTGNAYGIVLDLVMQDTSLFDTLSSPITTTDHGVDMTAAAWSAAGYLAMCGGKYLWIYSGVDLTQLIAKNINGENVKAVAWSHDGRYIAVGADSTYKNHEVFVYRFDPTGATADDILTSCGSFSTASVNSLAWSPDNSYLAVGTENDDYELQVWKFNGAEISIASVGRYAAGAAVNGVAFSPDSNFLASVYGTTINIFEIGSSNTTNVISSKVTDSPTAITTLRAVDWFPLDYASGYFVAVVGDGPSDQLEIFTYDGATSLATFAKESHDSADLKSVKWGPNGKYILVAGDDAAGNEVKIYYFNPFATTKLTLHDQGALAGGNATACDWSASGRYVIAVGQTSSGDDTAIYEVANVPTACKIESNNICNTTGGPWSIGLYGTAAINLIIKNIGYENDDNFSPKIFNVFEDGLQGHPTVIENISIPPYIGDERTDIDRAIDIENKVKALRDKLDEVDAKAATVNAKVDVSCCETLSGKFNSSLDLVTSFTHGNKGIRSVYYHPTLDIVAIAGWPGDGVGTPEVRILNSITLSEITTATFPLEAYMAKWSPDGNYLAIADGDDAMSMWAAGHVYVYELIGGTSLLPLAVYDHGASVFSVDKIMLAHIWL